jgi:methylated-DNA-[protein]-cysteine S-methyltransferase
MRSKPSVQVASVATDLGWVALLASADTLRHIVFGYPTQAAAFAALDQALLEQAEPGSYGDRIAARLVKYAAGELVDFSDLAIELADSTPFQRRVVKACRAIGYGQTCSYGELARRSGSGRAARAVGNTMAANRYPLVVPCHRVIHAGGALGGFSAADGTCMKDRLLRLEGRVLASRQGTPTKRRRATMAC